MTFFAVIKNKSHSELVSESTDWVVKNNGNKQQHKQ